MSPLRLVLAATLFSGALAAQLPDWGSVPAGPGATIHLEQSYCLVRSGNLLQVFSCLDRQWSTLLTLGAPAVRILNDAIVVQDGPLFYGYSPRTGQFAPLWTWSGAPVLAAPPTPQTWLAIVVDGPAVHVFQALEGTWTTHVCSGPPTVTMGTFCAVVHDGTHCHGISAFYGTPVRLDEAAGATAVVGAYGNAAIVGSTNQLHGFCAYRVAVTDTAPAVSLQRAVGIVVDAPFVHGYSALTGTTSAITAAAPTVAMQQWFALVADGPQLHAFGANVGGWTAPVVGALADVTTRAEMATLRAAPANDPVLVFSQYHGGWTPVPTLAGGLASVHETAASVVLVEQGGGLHALSVRGTNWVHAATPPIDAVHVGTSNPQLQMTVVARAGLDLWAFNSRVQAWRHTTTNAPATTFAGNNTALVLHDGATAYGYSSWQDRWTAQALQGPVGLTRAQVQSAYIQDAAAVHAYSGMGQLSTSLDYPEYWRASTLGARLRVHLTAEPGALAVLAFDSPGAELDLPGLGTLRLDLGQAAILATPVFGVQRHFSLPLQIPYEPALTGSQLHLQSLVFGPAGTYLTNAVDHLLLGP